MKNYIFLITVAMMPFGALASARYSVPVDGELRPYADFAVAQADAELSGDKLKIEYDLPLQLTGVTNRIVMEGRAENGKFQMVSANGHYGECSMGKQLLCTVGYSKLDFSRSEVEKAINAAYADDPETAAGKLAVAEVFSMDPGGVVIFEK